jgi:hypothetical protein
VGAIIQAQVSSTRRVLRSAWTEASRGDRISPWDLLSRANRKSKSCLCANQSEFPHREEGNVARERWAGALPGLKTAISTVHCHSVSLAGQVVILWNESD